MRNMEKSGKMTVIILSRLSAERLINNRFPDNTAVVCFYDPNGTHIDYSGIAKDVIYMPVDDFQLELTKADEIARFIYTAKTDGQKILCQCESGQSRSAGCAAAILEHFYGTGGDVFGDERYHPDEMVYYALLDALEAVAAGRKKQ